MSLQFILGNSGSGKSHLLYQKIIEESMRHPDRNYMVIVPEQFTMQTQKDLVMLHPKKGIMNIDVLSFRRLAHRIFEEVGADRRRVLTETGKNLMLRRVAALHQDELQVLGGKMNRPGYVSEVKSVLSELMQYEVTDEDMGELLEFTGNRPLLNAKLADIRLLYQEFLNYQREKFMKPEELLDVLCQVAGRSELLKNSTLAFDGFTGFTPSQMKVLEELFAICPKLWITVTIDVREPVYGEIQEHELFALSKKTIQNVTEAARRGMGRKGIIDGRDAEGQDERGVGKSDRDFLEEPILLGGKSMPRFRQGGALEHLERNLFRRRPGIYAGGKEENSRHISAEAAGAALNTKLSAATSAEAALNGKLSVAASAAAALHEELSMHISATPADEVHFAARTICRLVREQGYRYHDIAVITGNLASYDHYVKKIFPMYQVPAFLDETRHILLNPCLEFVRGALAVAERDFSYETVFRFLRTGMAQMPLEHVDILENYVLAAGIRGWRMWSDEWLYCPRTMTARELELCNDCRRMLSERLLPFTEVLRHKAPLREYAGALCDLMEAYQVQQQLKDREMELLRESTKTEGAREAAREYSQIYAILMGLLDEMVELLGDEVIAGQEFGEILDAGLSEASVGIIPPGIDQVQVGDITRSRLAHVKVLFFLGLNDGWVPAAGDGGGIVSDMEREILRQSGIELAPSARENSYIQRFYLYQNLTKPGERLYLSWCESNGEGGAMRPSYLAAVINRMFPQLAAEKEQAAGASVYQVTSKENGMLYMTGGLEQVRAGQPEASWLELYGMYLRDDRYRERVRELVRAAFTFGNPGRLTYQTSRELYGDAMEGSVTRLEQFASCAFAHFAAYGLHLTERELYGVKMTDLGTIFHRSMELFSRQLQESEYNWKNMPDDWQKERMEQCVDQVTAQYGAGELRSGARQQYTVCRIKRILCRSVWALHQQIKAGQFIPTSFEVSFENAGDLQAVNVKFGEQGKLRLKGRIDRIDTAETEDTVYVKIVDYKSGVTKFDPVSIYYGLQLQLVVYLNAALELERKTHQGKNVVPAGIFYYHLDDPVLEKEANLPREQLEEKLLKKMRPDGVLNSDGGILEMMDRNLKGDSLVIPAGLKKDGSLKAASGTATTEQFEQLSCFVSKKMERMAEQIMQGEISPRPFVDKNGSACDFCEYSDVCGFDRKIPGMSEKRQPDLRKDEAWEKIAHEAKS